MPEKTCCRQDVRARSGGIAAWVFRWILFGLLCGGHLAQASLETYDATITEDAAGGLTPTARLVSPVILNGTGRAAFDFGSNAGDASLEFVLTGNPAVGVGSAYLAVGANSSSNLRYKQWNNTGQLGFTQLGVADYLFSPGVVSPTTTTHIAYVWNATTLTMRVYVNGVLAGTRSAVDPGFGMPSGLGWLGANPSNTENMTGTIYRVTAYDDLVSPEVILRHADAFNGVVRAPLLVSFAAQPPAFFTPGSATLSWDVRQATAVFIDNTDVTTLSNLVVSPVATTTYVLVATNAGGSVTGRVTVAVNPAPAIQRFAASRTYVAAGEILSLSWEVTFGETYFITPGVGDVTPLTSGGIGTIDIQPTDPATYTLTASNAFGTNSASIDIHIVHPAGHVVISEFMAHDESSLADEDGDYSGWIELHNPTAAAVNLLGCFLTDDADDPTRWAFPALDLAPGAYLLVFASGKDRTNAAGRLHTNFELKDTGEYLALVGPGPVLLHAFAPAYPPQRADISYGLLGADVSVQRYFGLPSPGERNQEALPPPAGVQISPASSLFSDPFQVMLSAADPGAQIFYTLDGSTPEPTNGVWYAAPFTVTNTTHLRAVAFAFDQVSRVSGASYVKLAPELATYTSTLPIMVIENFGAGVIPQKGWNSSGAGLRQVPRQMAAWATFERMGGVSAFSNAPQMLSLVGIRGRGAYSTEWRQKPYSVEAIDEQGGEAEVSPLGLPAHADWVLYFPDPDQNKDPALLFNTFAYELSRNCGRYSVRFRWVEAFINEDGGELRLADRRGVYAIIEKVARGSDRLDFQRLSPDGTNGSWLLNINRMDPEPETGWPAPNGAIQPWFFHTAGRDRLLQTAANANPNPVPGDDQPQQWNAYINFDNPTGYTLNTNQRAAIEGWFRQFEDVLYSNSQWRDPASGYRQFLDAVDFADYFILNVLTRNGDGLLISIFPWKGDDGRLRIGPAWDYNWNAYYVSGVPTGALMHRSERLWYPRLFDDPDFLQLYIDRWWELRRGPMSNLAMEGIIDRQAADISPEKALLNGMPSTGEWTNRLDQMKTWLKQRADWIDSNYLRPPAFNQAGGPVPEGFPVLLSATNGSIYFTTDGSDPRASGGSLASNALPYQLPLAILAQTCIQARVRNGTNWSGLTSAVFYPPQDQAALAVTEIMYNPPAANGWSGEELEFIELKNCGANPMELGTLRFTAGIDFTFTNGTRLGAGQFCVLVRNPAAFRSLHPTVPIGGVYAGRLDNGGETLRLATALGATVFDLTYNDRAPWPLAADGHGFSAVPQDPSLRPNSDDGGHWRASASPGGSPGVDDPEPTYPRVVINEFITHTDPPEVDAIELFNPSAEAADIGGWFLSDDGTVPRKFRIPDGTVIPGGGYRVFTETDFNPVPGTLLNFALDSAGDALYLTAADAGGNFTGYGHGVDFGASAAGVSFGRYVNSIGEEQFPAQEAVTWEAANAEPLVGPVVISEILYHPVGGKAEFIELRNITDREVQLFDPARPTNTWRVNGLGFTLPEQTVLPAQGLMLIAGTNAAAFRELYPVPENVLVFGPFSGALQDNGERLELQRPDEPGTNGIPYITVDEVRYDDQAPWPQAADGGGASLQRRTPSAYGNDPTNWGAALPTPGTDSLGGEAPVITVHPQSRTAAPGQTVAFSVAATGEPPLQYHWLFNGAPLTDATNASLLLASVLAGDGGDYEVVVFNANGSALSGKARLRLQMPPLLLQQPTNVLVRVKPDPQAAVSTNAAFSVLAFSAYPLNYQWLSNGAPLLDATNQSLVITNVQTSHWADYTVAVSDGVGFVVSTSAWLYPLIRPGFSQGPISQWVAPGATVSLSAVATGWPPPFSFEWRRNSVSEWTNVQDTLTCFYSFVAPGVPTSLSYRTIIRNIAVPSGQAAPQFTVSVLADLDGDGLHDAWETAYGLSTNSPADRLLDADGDGMLNWQEYVAGTNPTNAASYLWQELTLTGEGTRLHFGAISNRTYTLERADSPEAPLWTPVADVVARPTNRIENVLDPGYGTKRFYRVTTPRRP